MTFRLSTQNLILIGKAVREFAHDHPVRVWDVMVDLDNGSVTLEPVPIAVQSPEVAEEHQQRI